MTNEELELINEEVKIIKILKELKKKNYESYIFVRDMLRFVNNKLK